MTGLVDRAAQCAADGHPIAGADDGRFGLDTVGRCFCGVHSCSPMVPAAITSDDPTRRRMVKELDLLIEQLELVRSAVEFERLRGDYDMLRVQRGTALLWDIVRDDLEGIG